MYIMISENIFDFEIPKAYHTKEEINHYININLRNCSY